METINKDQLLEELVKICNDQLLKELVKICKDRLFEELVKICKKSGAKPVNRYYDDTCCNSLISYSTLVSHQSDYFLERFIYFIDKDEKIIYLEHGWSRGAHQILLKFNENSYHYDFYELPYGLDEHQYPEESDYDTEVQYKKAEHEYFSFWENWNKQHTIDTNADIFTVLKQFDQNEDDQSGRTFFSNIIQTLSNRLHNK